MRWFFVWIWLCACLRSGGVASAQEGGELADEEARNLYQAGAIAFDQGRFENALEYFERAYALSKRPQLLFNVGVVADRLRLDERALQAFERYLAEVPDGAEAANVRARIEVLKRTLAERSAQAPPSTESTAAPGATHAAAESGATEPAASPATTRPTPAAADSAQAAEGSTTPASSSSSVLPWLLVGAGAAAAITGGVLLAVGQSRRAKIEDAEVGTSWSEVAAYDDADTFTGLGVAALAAGAASAVIGSVMLAGDDGESASSRAHAQLLVGPGVIAVRGAL